MYFQKLHAMRSEFLNKYKGSIEENEYTNAIDKLDTWLSKLTKEQSDWLNPLQFADATSVSWGVASEIFNIASERGVFVTFLTVEDENGEMLASISNSDDVKKLKNKNLYSYDENKEIPFDPDDFQINVWYKLDSFPVHENPNKEVKPLKSLKYNEAAVASSQSNSRAEECYESIVKSFFVPKR